MPVSDRFDITMRKIHRRFDDHAITDPAGAIREQLRLWRTPVEPDQSICVAVGSRGITFLDVVVREVVDFVKSRGARPFIIPAMGSHGGATPEGQEAVLAGYGITETAMGAPIVSDMEVETLPSEGLDFRVFMSRAAVASDGVILINRIKPHTDYHGKYESGLVKMSVIGLGKHAQALEIHGFGADGLRRFIPEAAGRIFETGKIIAGIAIVENRLHAPALIELIPGEAIADREPFLLEAARKLMPQLPVDRLDLLVVDYIGKDFSGTGLDTNVIGRMRIRGEAEPTGPSIKSIVVRDLSERSDGNALGIGLADVITRRLFERIDYGAMYENAFTSTFLERVKIPVIASCDREAIRFALRGCGVPSGNVHRIVRIMNTLQLEEMYVSEPVWEEIIMREEVRETGNRIPLCAGEEMPPF